MGDYYSILRIPRSADESAIKAAYRKLAKRYHPDVNPGEEAKARFLEINEAYETLVDPKKRALYDNPGKPADAQKDSESSSRSGSGNRAPVRPVSMEDVRGAFEGFFGFNPKTGAPVKKPQGKGKASPMDTSELFEAFMRRKR